MSETKRCPGCKKQKPLNQFRLRGASAGGRAGKPYGNCRPCNQLREAARFNQEDPGPFLMAMVQARARSTTKGWHLSSFDVIEKWTEQEGKCALSGKPMTHIRGDGAVYTNVSIDRIDNEKGYTKDNIHLVCFIANLMKSTMSVDELVEWCKTITRHQKKHGRP